MNDFLSKYANLLERMIWTAIQAGLGLVTVDALDVSVSWAPMVAMVLAVVKGLVASRMGKTGSCATLPASLDK